jgi:hypothetical protein
MNRKLFGLAVAAIAFAMVFAYVGQVHQGIVELDGQQPVHSAFMKTRRRVGQRE